MNNPCTQKFHFEEKEKGFYICSVCECPLGTHCFYVHCPLIENELICIDCCQNNIPYAEGLKTLKELGKEYKREDVEKICEECGCRNTGTSVKESEDKL